MHGAHLPLSFYLIVMASGKTSLMNMPSEEFNFASRINIPFQESSPLLRCLHIGFRFCFPNACLSYWLPLTYEVIF